MCLNKCFRSTEDFFTSEAVKHEQWLFALVLELKISLLNFVSLLKLVIFISTIFSIQKHSIYLVCYPFSAGAVGLRTIKFASA